MPTASRFSAVPETIWSARSVTANSACSAAKTAPATIAITIPRSHEPVLSAPSAPKNAPISIMPSSAMLMTPERSEKSPPSAPSVSGVA